MHFEIHASEPQRLIDFYSGLFGWTFTPFGDAYWVIETGEGSVQMDKPGFGINGGLVPRQGPAPEPGAPVNGCNFVIGTDDVDALFGKGLELETSDPNAARKAYERAVHDDAELTAAWINLGRLQHEHGQMREAERTYRAAIAAVGQDALLMFNLGVLLEDLNRPADALEAYQVSLSEDPSLADCHYNLARLYESQGRPQHAIRHLGQYRRLVIGDSH